MAYHKSTGGFLVVYRYCHLGIRNLQYCGCVGTCYKSLAFILITDNCRSLQFL